MYNYGDYSLTKWKLIEIVIDFEEIFYGFNDFLVAIMILYLFYLLGSENIRKSNRKGNKQKKK